MSRACVCHISPETCYWCESEKLKKQLGVYERLVKLNDMDRKNQIEAHNKTIQAYRDEITSLHVEMSKMRNQLRQATTDHPVCGAIARVENEYKFVNIKGEVRV